MNTLPTRTTFLLAFVVSLLSTLLAGHACASLFFTEDFSGTTLDPAWSQLGDPGGHTGLNGSGQYIMSDAHGAPGTELRRSTGGSPSSFDANIDVALSPFLDPNTGTDFKWRFFGPDGFVEVVLNSFNDIRVFSNHAQGNVGGPLSLTGEGFADGETLNLSLSYSLGTDTFDVEYGFNGGATTNLATYTGAGDFYTNWTDVQMFKFGADGGNASAALDSYNIVPEPATTALCGIGAVALLLLRRRSVFGRV
jgi:hypothetical protein